MIRAWLAAAAIVGVLSVVAGAVAAHLGAGDRTSELLRIGSLYGMVHAAALIGTTAMADHRSPPGVVLIVAGWSFAVGLLLFSLSLFGLALTGIARLGIVTPVGGVGLLIGWASLGVYAMRHR